jgi:hypothetical protein
MHARLLPWLPATGNPMATTVHDRSFEVRITHALALIIIHFD